MPAGFLGIDAGGSHCRARLVNAHGQVIGDGHAGPANTRIGIGPLRETLVDVSEQAVKAAGLPITALGDIAAGMGIAGISRAGVIDQLLQSGLPYASVQVTSDAAIANLGAHHGQDGAVLILGTGSVGYGKVGETIFSIGGYGFPISDEGSGAALGLSAIRHALRALDGRTKATTFSARVTGRFDHAIPKIIAWMDAASPRDYATFAPLVLDCAEGGDEIALSIVEDAVLHIERFIDAIFQRGAPRLSLIGGLAHRYRPWLRERTAARLATPLGDALDGALILAGYRPA